MPKFLGYMEPFAEEGKWICGSEMTVADFWLGSLFVDMIFNEKVGYGRERWASCLDSYPNLKAY